MKMTLNRILSLLLVLVLTLGLAVPALAAGNNYVTAVTITPGGPENRPVGKTRQLSATVSYANSAAKTGGVTWSSTRETVADVTADGLVTARAVGTTYIVAAAKDPGEKGRIVSEIYAVTVTEPDPTVDDHRLILGASSDIEYAGRYFDKTLNAPDATVMNGEENVTDKYLFTYTWKDQNGKAVEGGLTASVIPIAADFETYTCQVTAVNRSDSTKILTASCLYRLQILPTTVTTVTTNFNDGARSLSSLTDADGRTFLSQLLYGGEDLQQTPAMGEVSRVVFDDTTVVGAASLNVVGGEPYYTDETAEGRHLTELAFTPTGEAGLYRVDFLAYTAAGAVYFGRLEIVITGQTVAPPVGSDLICDSAGIAFSGADFYRAEDDDPVVAVVFDAPENGILLRNFRLGKLTLDDEAKYYTNSARDGAYHISTLTYLPHAGFSGEDLLPVTLITRSGRSIPDALTIHVTTKTSSDYFGDVVSSGSGSWSADAIDFAYGNGLVSGMAEDTFAPDLPMNRAMLVTILYRASGSPVVTVASPFSDLVMGSYYCDPVLWALAEHIVNGTSETTFEPETPITREQIAVILHRYAETLGDRTEPTGTLDAFSDQDTVSDYAVDSLRWAVSQKIISGVARADGTVTLSPKDPATRAQVVVMLHRCLSNL